MDGIYKDFQVLKAYGQSPPEFRDFFNIHKIYSWRVDVLTVNEVRLVALRVLQV